MEFACDGAVGDVGGDEGGDRDSRGIGKELCNLSKPKSKLDRDRKTRNGSHLADTPDVLVTRLFVEPEVLVETKADVVAVEAVGEFVQMK